MLMERFADAGAALAEGLRLAPDSAGLQAAMAHLRREWPEAAGPAPGPPAAAAGADWGSAAKRCGRHGVKSQAVYCAVKPLWSLTLAVNACDVTLKSHRSIPYARNTMLAYLSRSIADSVQ